MRRFADLVRELDRSADDAGRVNAWARYLVEAPLADAAWAVHLLTARGVRAAAVRRPRGLKLPIATLRGAACRAAGVEDWLFESCLQAAGDAAETIAHLLPRPVPAGALARESGLAVWMAERLPALAELAPQAQAEQFIAWLAELEPDVRALLIRLVCGSFRKQQQPWPVARALAARAGVDAALLALRLHLQHRLRFDPSPQQLSALWTPLQADGAEAPALPVARAEPAVVDFTLDQFEHRLGAVEHWIVQWLHDGIRVQLRRTADQCWLWSAQAGLLNARYPALMAAASTLPPGCVIDGVVAPGRQGAPPGAQLLADELPDAWTHELIVPVQRFRVSSWPEADQWRRRSHAHGTIGLRLMPAGHGAAPGHEPPAAGWLWRADPMCVRAVLAYAEAGSGVGGATADRYTFALWSRAPRDEREVQHAIAALERGELPKRDALRLLPVARIGIDLDDATMRTLSQAVADSTVQRFGPVRVIKPGLLFEIGFEGVVRNARRKSGLELLRPVVLRALPSAAAHQADSCDRLLAISR